MQHLRRLIYLYIGWCQYIIDSTSKTTIFLIYLGGAISLEWFDNVLPRGVLIILGSVFFVLFVTFQALYFIQWRKDGADLKRLRKGFEKANKINKLMDGTSRKWWPW